MPLVFFLALSLLLNRAAWAAEPLLLTCKSPYALDGDTFACGKTRVRLKSIDAPEMPGHCNPGRRCTPGDPVAARKTLKNLLRGGVTCRVLEHDSYGRAIALCINQEDRDLSCAMVESGRAVRRYGDLTCP